MHFLLDLLAFLIAATISLFRFVIMSYDFVQNRDKMTSLIPFILRFNSDVFQKQSPLHTIYPFEVF